MTIRELRKEKNLTQAEFARSIGIGVSTVGTYESGRAKPSAAVLAKIREVYGVDLGDKKPTAAQRFKKRTAKKPDETQIIIQSPWAARSRPSPYWPGWDRWTRCISAST
ncbi:MAG: helix-turn-helix transcriptional regulator [Clostridia bacterium]|nr:helix-turn-helix transcriptional regulator [Clostridia bacterium]